MRRYFPTGLRRDRGSSCSSRAHRTELNRGSFAPVAGAVKESEHFRLKLFLAEKSETHFDQPASVPGTTNT